MTINELLIQLDLQPENRIDILEDVARKCCKGYFFVDSNDDHCYLFDENGNEDDIKKIKNIENYAFWSCQSLTSIVIPNSVESINFGAFEWCESLKSIIIPNSVESIGNEAFLGCKSLKSVVIPDSVKSIGNRVFWSCNNLKSLTFKGKTIDQVKKMIYYPFGIENESIIKCI